MNAPIADQLNTGQQDANQDTWVSAMDWVNAHKRIVHWVAEPYLPYMAADEDDLFQEAVIAAVQALIVARTKKSPQKLASFFRVIFKTRCVRMATGIQTVPFSDESLLYTASQKEEEASQDEPHPERHHAEIEKALQRIGGRQQEICAWILCQSRPVSTMETARHFHVSPRQIYRLLRHTLLQLNKAA